MKLHVENKYDCDVLIVGAGPAGAACGYHLASAGLKVFLLDYQSFPRDKVCGDFVGPVAIKELNLMGINALTDFTKTNTINQAALFVDGKLCITKDLPVVEGLPDHGRVIPRMILDNWIVRAAVRAGVILIENCRCNDFKTFTNGIMAICKIGKQQTTYYAKLLVGADGSSSTISRIVTGEKPKSEDRIVAVRAYYENIHCISNQAELYFTSKSFPGYYWLFPTGSTTANIGVGMVLENFPKEETNLKDLLLELIEKDTSLGTKIGNGRLADKVVGWPLSTYNPDMKNVAERVVLIGDAAGLINSLNGEGIQYAMLSGRWASETITSCLKQEKFDVTSLSAYSKKIKSEVGYDMALANTVIQFIRNRTLNQVWLKLLAVIVDRAKYDKTYADIAGGILAGLVPANKAITFSFLSKTALQALHTTTFETIKSFTKGPAHLTRLFFDASRAGLHISSDMLTNYKDYIKWGKGIFTTSAHLSGHVIKDMHKKIVGQQD
ncbi:MAG: NAD(P)/FAD-dependent oxidoreductase [Chitinophagaceae bacterium]